MSLSHHGYPRVQQHNVSFNQGTALVVGSFGSLHDLLACTSADAMEACDVIEVRLDLLLRDGWRCGETPWTHLRGLPLLFTARCQQEGGALPLTPDQRGQMLAAVLDDAAAVDVEIASISTMREIITTLKNRSIPWVASCHRFDQTPTDDWWRERRDAAAHHGATVAKFAAMLHDAKDIETLVRFQSEASTLCVATMGMGPLAAVSRVRCALAGSVLNYGYLGEAPTAPGQWPAARLRAAIRVGEVPEI